MLPDIFFSNLKLVQLGESVLGQNQISFIEGRPGGQREGHCHASGCPGDSTRLANERAAALRYGMYVRLSLI